MSTCIGRTPPLPCMPCKLPSNPLISNTPIRGDKTPTNLPINFERLFLHTRTPHQVPMHGEAPLPCKVPSNPHISHIPIRGDKTPTDSPPIFYYLPTNFWLLFLYSHTPHQPPNIGNYPLSCKLPSDPLILHLHIRGDKTPTNSPSIFYYFPTNFRPLFLYSHTPHQSPHPWGVPPGRKVPSNPHISHAPIGGGFVPANSPPIPHRWGFIPHQLPTNFRPLFLHCHIAHHPPNPWGLPPRSKITFKSPYSPCPYPWGQNPHQFPTNILLLSHQFWSLIFILPYSPPYRHA